MTMLTMSVHPSEETLSRLADQSEIERLRSRAGRHAAHCERCRAEIAAIGALGEAARAIPDPVLRDTVGERIAERRRNAPPLAPSLVGTSAGESGTSVRPRGRWTGKAWAGTAAAAAIALLALLGPVWRRHTLAAASAGEATIYPRYPRAGATAGVRFFPGAEWTGGDTLWASGIIDLRSQPGNSQRVTSVAAGAALLRDRDGAYRGRLVLPDDALSGVLEITTVAGPARLPQSVAKLVVLTGSAEGDRPSLDALESAVYNDHYFMRAAVLADAFARWAPSHPMRWLVEDLRPTGGVFDWTHFFDSEERRFARLTEQLNARTDVRPAELAGMAGLAYRIEEPAVAAEWTERLVREHPDDPWALDLRVKQIHEMELRSAPTDSIARLVPSLDSLYPTSRISSAVLFNITLIANRYADPATQRRWELRAARAGRVERSGYLGQGPTFEDPELRDSIAAYAGELVRRDPAPSPWNGPIHLLNPELQRAIGYSLLASVALARHEYRMAVALSDSARVSNCVWPGQGTRGLALLALGDTAAAIPMLAAYGRGPGAIVADSARGLLGSRLTPERWQATLDSAERVRMSCRRQRT